MVASRKVSVGPIVSYEEACRCLEFDGVDFFVLLQPHPAFGNSDVIPREEVEKLLFCPPDYQFTLMTMVPGQANLIRVDLDDDQDLS